MFDVGSNEAHCLILFKIFFCLFSVVTTAGKFVKWMKFYMTYYVKDVLV